MFLVYNLLIIYFECYEKIHDFRLHYIVMKFNIGHLKHIRIPSVNCRQRLAFEIAGIKKKTIIQSRYSTMMPYGEIQKNIKYEFIRAFSVISWS